MRCLYVKINCAYIRLSEEDIGKSEEYSNSIVNQIEIIEEYAKRNNIRIDKKFIDDGYSGINFCRPAFEQMIMEAESNNVETIITKDFSRLGREFIETSFYITRFFPEHSIRYIAVNEFYDSFNKNDDSKEMMVGIKGIINDRYIKETSRKIKSVKEQKTENGYYMGFIAPYGYKKIRANNNRITLIEDVKVSEIVKQIFQDTISGKSKKEIAEELNLKGIDPPIIYMNMTKSRGKSYYDKWNSGIVYRIIRNITYTGNTYKRKSSKEDYRQKKRKYICLSSREIIKNTHPAIIDMETFVKANNTIRKNSTKTNRIKDYIGVLDGIVKCGECGKKMNVCSRKRKKGKVEYYFYCTDGKNKNKVCTNNRIIYIKKLEELIYFHVKTIVDDLDNDEIVDSMYKYVISRKKLKSKIEGINKEIEFGKNKIKELYLQKVDNLISLEEFKEKINKINEQNKELQNQIIELTNNIDFAKQKEEISKIYKDLKNENNLMKYINNLVKEIRFYGDRRIEIKVY